MGDSPAPRLPASAFRVSLLELATELGLSSSALRMDVVTRGLETRLRVHPAHTHRVSCLRPEDAATLRAAHAQQRARLDEVAHWLSTEQAARALGVSLNGFHSRWRKSGLKDRLRRKRIYGRDCPPGGGWRFHPGDVAREARRIGVRARSLPRGALSTVDLEALGELGMRTTIRWRAQGLPYRLDISGDAYYLPAQVITWLEGVLARPHSRPAPARRLLAALQALVSPQCPEAAD